MAKKRKSKSDRRLRRDIEILKAQLKSSGQIVKKPEPKHTPDTESRLSTKEPAHKPKSFEGINVNTKHVKKDLVKTLFLSAIGFGIILFLAFYR